MSDYTTIQLSKKTKMKLDKMKVSNNESYNDIIEQLIQAGSDVLISTKHNQTCLSYSIMQNDNYLLEILFNSVSILLIIFALT